MIGKDITKLQELIDDLEKKKEQSDKEKEEIQIDISNIKSENIIK